MFSISWPSFGSNFSFKGIHYTGIYRPGDRLIHPRRIVLGGYNITGHRPRDLEESWWRK